MKVADLVFFSAELMKKLHGFGIRIDDYKYVALYEEYEVMKAAGNKTVFIVAKLSEKHNLSERLIYKVLRHFKRDC